MVLSYRCVTVLPIRASEPYPCRAFHGDTWASAGGSYLSDSLVTSRVIHRWTMASLQVAESLVGA